MYIMCYLLIFVNYRLTKKKKVVEINKKIYFHKLFLFSLNLMKTLIINGGTIVYT